MATRSWTATYLIAGSVILGALAALLAGRSMTRRIEEYR